MPSETNARRPRAPAGLGAAGKRLWSGVLDDFDLTTAELSILEAACREADLIASLQKAIDGMNGNYRVKGSQGQDVAAPELTEIRLHRGLLGQLLGRLKLPDVDDETMSFDVTGTVRRVSFGG